MAIIDNSKMELFQSIYTKHYETVYTFILISLNNDKDLAGDCMQDTAALVMQKLDIVAKHPNPGGFFIVTAKNFIQKYKAAQRRKQIKSVPFDEAMAAAAYNEDFDRIFDERINIEKFKQEVLKELSHKDFELYSMFYERKMSILQIASALQITEGNVKVRLFRLRAKVKTMVSEIFKGQR